MTFQTKTAVSLTSWTDMNLNQCNKKLYIIHNLAFLAGACHSTYRKMFVLCNFKDIVALSYHTNVKTVQQILSTPGHTLRCLQAVVLDRQLGGVERTDCDVPLPVKFYKKARNTICSVQCPDCTVQIFAVFDSICGLFPR